jgi:hypothetical protein
MNLKDGASANRHGLSTQNFHNLSSTTKNESSKSINIKNTVKKSEHKVFENRRNSP